MVLRSNKNRALFFSLISILSIFLLALFFPADASAQGAPQFSSATYFGGTGDELGRGIAISGSDLYVTGQSGTEGLLVQYGIPLGAPVWNTTLAGNTSLFGVAPTSTNVYATGSALPSACGASDGAGGTEQKSALAWYTTGGTPGGCVSPNFFSYRGGEGYLAALAVQEASTDFVYATGFAQASGVNNTAVLAKYDSTGNLLWSRNLGNTGSTNNSAGLGMVVGLAGNLYVAGNTHYPYTDTDALQAALWKYDSSGNQIWSRSYQPSTGVTAYLMAVGVGGGYIYAAGYSNIGPNGGQDALILKYDASGTLVWSKEWGGTGNEVANGIAVLGGHLYVVGETASFGNGGKDAFLLEVDPADGTVLSTDYWGGTADDIARGVAVAGSDIYIVGETASFGGGGKDLMLLRYVIDAGSISGTVSYGGTQSGTIFVCASLDPTFEADCTGEATLSSPGSYSITGLPDNTYYVGSIMSTTGDPDQMLFTDPWGGFGTSESLTPVTISNQGSVANVDITLIDGTESNPNPFVESPADARSHHGSDGYYVHFEYEDPNHDATSVSVTGEGITDPLNLAYDTERGAWLDWITGADGPVSFGTTPPTPPLTYTFSITENSVTSTMDATVCCFITELPTNLSPSGGQTVNDAPEFTWTAISQTDVYYQVQVNDSNDNRIWDSLRTTATSITYAGPMLSAGATYTYFISARDEEGNESLDRETFLFGGYSNPGTISGTVSYSGSPSGVIVIGALGANWISEVQISSTGAYTIPNLPDGTYRVASVMISNQEEGSSYTDPWGVYGTQVTISGGNAATGADITLSDGTGADPNPWGHRDEGSVSITVSESTITVDGDPSDWSAIQPVLTDPQGDDLSLQSAFEDKQGADIADIYLARDANNLYMRMDLYDGPANITFRNNCSGLSNTGRYMLSLHSGDTANPMDIEVDIIYSSQQAAWYVSAEDINLNHQHITAIEAAAVVATANNTIELSLPLSELPSLSNMYIHPSIFSCTGSEIWSAFPDRAKRINTTSSGSAATGSISGTITAANGTTPIENIHVEVFCFDATCGGSVIGDAFTDASGDYSVTGLYSGRYAVEASGTAYRTEWYDNAVLRNGAALVEVFEGQDTTGIFFALDATDSVTPVIDWFIAWNLNVPQTDGSTAVVVMFLASVTDPDGTPPGSILSASVIGPGLQTDLTLVHTDLGIFGFQYFNTLAGGPYEGTYTFTVEDVNNNTATASDNIEAVTLPIVDSNTFNILNGATVNTTSPLFCWDPVTHTDPVLYRVQIKDSTGAWVARSDPNGSTCAIIAEGTLTPGDTYDWRVDVFEDVPFGIGASSGRSRSNYSSLTLDTGALGPGSILGTVTEADGVTPIQDMHIKVFEFDSPDKAAEVWTDVNGDYTLSGLPAGEYAVKAQGNHSGYRNEWYINAPQRNGAAPVTVTAEQNTTGVDFALQDISSTTGAITWWQNPANGHYYTMVNGMSWQDTEALAVDLGGHIVTINDLAEETWIINQFGAGDIIIGLNDINEEGTWVWVSGEPVTYTNWCQNEPNNFEDEDIAVLNNCWNDVPASGQVGAIIESTTATQSADPVINWFAAWNWLNPADQGGQMMGFFTKIIDPDGGLPSSITSITVTGPGLSTPLDLSFDDFGIFGLQYSNIVAGGPNAGTYTLTVTDIDGNVTTASDTIEEVTLPIVDLATYTITSGTTFPTFCWGPVTHSDPVMYRVQVREFSSGTWVAKSDHDPSTCATIADGYLNPGETYDWRVDVFESNSFGVGGSSGRGRGYHSSFTVAPDATATSSISGTVTAAGGTTPISGIRVVALHQGLEGEDVTVADGSYSIDGLDAFTNYLIVAFNNGLTFQDTFWNSTGGTQNMEEAESVPPGSTERDFSLVGTGVRFSGHILPIGSRWDTLQNGWIEGIEATSGKVVTVLIDLDKMFFSRVLEPGTYDFTIVVPYSEALSNNCFTAPPTLSAVNLETVDVQQDFQLGTTASYISGRITDLGTGNGLVDAEASAIELSSGEESGYADINSEGYYTISCLPAGNYAVAALAFDGEHIPEFYDHQFGFSDADPVTTINGSGISGIDFALDVDTDGDGLTNSVETDTGIFVSETDTGTDPGLADTDGDGVQDLAEILAGTDPNLNTSTPIAADLAAAGKELLGLFAFNPANRAFEEALRLDPNNEIANFFYAITRILDFIQSTELQNILTRFGFAGEVNLMQEEPPFGLTEPETLPEELPTGGEIQDLLTATSLPGKTSFAATPESLLNELEGALLNLERITNTNFQTSITTESPLPLEVITIEFDYGDVLMMQSGFSFFKSILLVLAAYDLNIDIDDLLNLMELDDIEGVLDLVHDNTVNTTLLALLDSSLLTQAKAALSDGIDFYLLGSASIRGEADVQEDDFITIDPLDSGEARFRDFLGDLANSLLGPAAIRDMDPLSEEVMFLDLTKLFDDPILDIGDILPISADVVRDPPVTGEITDVPLPDETFHGILPLTLDPCALRGDADDSGTTDILDAILILRIAASIDDQPTTDAGFCKTDLDGSLVVDIQDVLLAMRKVLGL